MIKSMNNVECLLFTLDVIVLKMRTALRHHQEVYMRHVPDMIQMSPFLKQTGRMLKKLLMENQVFFNLLQQ